MRISRHKAYTTIYYVKYRIINILIIVIINPYFPIQKYLDCFPVSSVSIYIYVCQDIRTRQWTYDCHSDYNYFYLAGVSRLPSTIVYCIVLAFLQFSDKLRPDLYELKWQFAIWKVPFNSQYSIHYIC